MPRRSADTKPPHTMTWIKASPVLALCLMFDALRFLFGQFWFFGPLLIGAGTAAATSGWAGSWIGGGLGTAAGSIAAYFGGPALTAFGVVMAMAIGFLGWLTIGLVLLMTNGRIFKENERHALWFAFSLLISEVPIIGSLPGLTGVTVKMYHAQIKKDKEKLKQYKKDQAEIQRRERDEKIADLMQARAAQLAEADIY